jgi:N-acetylglutamate synthase-like GNAT family acetyltransferase
MPGDSQAEKDGQTELRRACADDFSAIRALVRQGGINPFGLAWERFLVVVNEQGEVIACGQIKPHADGSRELASITVRPTERGQGYARLVIERLLAENSPPLYLTCRSTFGPLYKKFGFHPVDPPAMPPYFRRLSRIADWFSWLNLAPDRMLVMRWEGEPGGSKRAV